MQSNYYLEIIRQAQAAGTTISHQYLQTIRDRLLQVRFAERAPETWQAVMSKRYVLPAHRINDYIRQEVCDYLFLDVLMSYTGGRMRVDSVVNSCYISALHALRYGRPTFYLERELGEALLRTELPLDLAAADIKWPFPQFRVYLPTGLVGLQRPDSFSSSMFLDINRMVKGERCHLPPAIRTELAETNHSFYFPNFDGEFDGISVSTNLHFDSVDSNMTYALTGPYDGTLSDILNYSHTQMAETVMTDQHDADFTLRFVALAFNLLLFLDNYPINIESTRQIGTHLIRRPKFKGKHYTTGLYQPHFVGLASYHPSRVPSGLPVVHTGRTLAQHWRKGHWKRQPYGPRSENKRRFIWINLYQAGGSHGPGETRA